jgi:MFS family permease
MRVPLRRLLVLYLVTFNGFVGYSLMITIFTPLLVDGRAPLLAASASHSSRALVLGVLLTLYPLGQFIGAPVLGGLSDRYGRRPVLLASLAIAVGCYLLVAWALARDSLGLLMIACFVGGLFEANVAVTQSALADVSEESERGRVFGYVYLAISLAYVVGPLAAGPLGDQALISWARPWTPFVVVAGLLAVTAGAVWLRLPETRTSTEQPAGTGRSAVAGAALDNLRGFARGFKDVRLRRLLLTNLAFYLAIFGFFRVYPLYLVDAFRVSLTRESLFVAWVAVPIVVANLGVVAALLRRYDMRTVMAGAGLLAGASLIVVPLPGKLDLLWLTLALSSLGVAILLPLCSVRISAAVAADEQGLALGSNQALQVGGEAVSGLVGGALAAIVSGLPLVVFGVVALVATALGWGRRPTPSVAV